MSTPREKPLASQRSASRKKLERSKKYVSSTESHHRTSHTPTASQSDVLSHDQKATPLKQAYAGSTFHLSPAASSLPMPSFCKSFPTVSPSPPLASTAQLDGEGLSGSDMDTLVPIQPAHTISKGRVPSPLDFMFEAARKARDPANTHSPYFQASGSSTPGDNPSDSVFPFELDGNGGRPGSIGPSFATSYKTRIEAYKAQSHPPIQNISDEERKKKSAALKELLGNDSPLHKSDMNGYFTDQAGRIQPVGPYLQRSGPLSGPLTPQSKFQHAPFHPQHLDTPPAATTEYGPPAQPPIFSPLTPEYQLQNQRSPAAGLDQYLGTPPRGDRKSVV